MNERAERALTSLPRYYQSSAITTETISAAMKEFDFDERERDDIFAQFILETATWSLERWEKEFGVQTVAGDSIGMRRARIKAKIVTRSPMNLKRIRDLINVFVASKSAKVYRIPDEYAFEAQIPIDELEWLPEIVVAVEKAKPAHLEFLLAPSTNETIEIQERAAVNIRRYHKVHEFRVGMKPMKYQSEEVL
ncbi:putative phage tail protein [Aneurinibacillus aneurinilyticus]|uniref:putative phage tail protein n=1 Tax=Aneurinibacillus aneurinilyticus TaxID=1391 RepID=UPI0035256811